MEKQCIVGVDIGSFKVSATAAKVDDNDELIILDSVVLESQGIENGEIININEVASILKECISNLELLINSPIKEVYLGIPGGICKILDGKGDIGLSKEEEKIEERHIERVLKVSKEDVALNDEEIIDIIPYRYIVDDDIEIKDPIGLKANRLESNTKLVVAKKPMIISRLKVFQSIGINIKALLIQSESSKDMYDETTYFKENTMIIDTGSDISDVAYYEEGILIDTFSIPLGGNIITKDIAFCNNINNKSAESLKKKDIDLSEMLISIKKEEDLMQSNIVEQIILARVEEILSLIETKAKERGYEIDSIVLLGGGISLFKGIRELASGIMNKPVYILNPKETLNKPLAINSFGIVKNVYNELKLNNNNNNSNEIQYDKQKEKIDKEDLEFKNARIRKRSNKSFVSKIKKALDGFF
ncbi:cell division protein FtsA [Clostridium algidicarnis]|uniref:Cell division protein FtsA n=1 Tax=Clostridium algidicarnis TaxID=37659 RepID=A0ABS6BZM5_9CLOT|nr:cell division protein FtsA [Clostridium algidicarnis]MBU3193444.1 cell division protein FtsA [Clostridium algidicarnis]MBU3218687.1 cell division protein FtsA [Clostridium algidicarnis]